MLTSKRLNFSLITIDDVPVIHALHALPETDRYNTLGIPEDVAETREIITPWIAENGKEPIVNYTMALRQKESGLFIGLFGLKLSAAKQKRAEIWYKIHKDFWQKGYGTEAVETVLKFCFEGLKLHRVEAGCAVGNIGSIKLLERVGMTKEGRKRKVLPLVNGWSDNFEYAILNEDFRQRKKYEKVREK